MRNFFTIGLGAFAALCYSVMATAAPPDFQLELMQLDAGPGETIAPYIADDVAFVAVGDARAFMALPAGEYQIERMSGSMEIPGLRPSIHVNLQCQEVGVSFDTRGSPIWA